MPRYKQIVKTLLRLMTDSSRYPAVFRTAAAVLLFLLLGGGFVPARAVDRATFSWLANPPEDNVIGYRLYYGSESRFNLDRTLKTGFTYDYYIDFVDSKRCVADGTDADCQDLSVADFQCANLYGDQPLCTVGKLHGVQYFAMTAYNAQAESGFTRELIVRFDGAGPREIAVLSAINTLLRERKK